VADAVRVINLASAKNILYPTNKCSLIINNKKDPGNAESVLGGWPMGLEPTTLRTTI
jgi:hypothetical protein